MNVKDTVVKKIADNDEITNIKKILGLEAGMVYTPEDRKQKLRYGSLMLMTDSDVDGSHIKGLVFNLFHSLWPSLMSDKFLTSMLTPIIKARKKDKVLQFYNLTDYENWKATDPNTSGWKIKYYKGLGTSTNQEAKEYFKDMRMVTYNFTGDASDEGMYLAFDKKKADDRKRWLAGYDKQRILDYKTTHVSYEDFINKELIHFSNYDLERSLPNMCDGLKISQRKIMYSCFKRNLTTDEIRVAQLAGYVSENSAYHHGEASLQAAIVGLAQNYTGSNNLNLLMPNGQFGSRMHGGKDASQPRYIHTLLSPAACAVYMKEDADVLKYVDDDGILVEPEHYMPIIPMLLVNGAIGIGTGFSTNIPCYNPADIVAVIRDLLAGHEVTTASDAGALMPWYRGFKGTISQATPTKYTSKGTFSVLPGVAGKTQVRITELPIGTWTFDYKEELEALLDKIPDFKKYENKSSEDIDIVLHFTEGGLSDMLEIEENGLTKLENTFKLVSSKWLTTSNMYAFNSKGQITKYTTPLEIIKEHYDLRLEFYQKRKDSMLAKYTESATVLGNKRRFIKLVVTETIKVHKMKKDELEAYLAKEEFDTHNDSYDYIIRIPVYNLTKDKVDELDQEIASLRHTIVQISAKTVESMWGDDLDVFEKRVEFKAEKAKAGSSSVAASGTKAKKVVTKPKAVKAVTTKAKAK
jgi:DNA topoisomerase-2